MIKTLEHDYRILLNSYANKGDHNFSQLDRYEEREALVSQQRSIEFFHLFINKKQLINPTHPRFRILILPPQSLTELQLSFAEKIISLFAFGIMVTLTSFTRSIKTILSILSLPSSPGLNKKTDGFIYQKLPPRSLDAKTSGDYEMGTWLAKNYFHKPLHILKLNSINTSSFVSACCLSLKIKILTQSIFMFALYLLYLLSGKWERLYLLDDRIKCKLVRQCCIDALSNHYFFCFQGTPYRPLWTWDAEKRGSKIIQYFNSSSKFCLPLTTGLQTPPELAMARKYMRISVTHPTAIRNGCQKMSSRLGLKPIKKKSGSCNCRNAFLSLVVQGYLH